MHSELYAKYNVAGPRYTSYPTVPYWDESTFSPPAWGETLRRAFAESNEAEGVKDSDQKPHPVKDVDPTPETGDECVGAQVAMP